MEVKMENAIKEDKIPNLWNCVLNKTKRVIRFVQELEPPVTEFSRVCKRCSCQLGYNDDNCPKCKCKESETVQIYDLEKFESIKEEALSKWKANDILYVIGYVNHKSGRRFMTR